ncbi:MAG: hypothetical protein ACR2GA_01135 [Chloroflexota bacterium]
MQQSDRTCAALVARGAHYQAAVAPLDAFEAWFSTSLQDSQPEDIAFNFYADDGWKLGIGRDGTGDQPSYVDGAMSNAPAKQLSPIQRYTVVGAYNQRRAPTETKVTVDFPGAGTYPVELDYTEWCGLPAVFVLTAVGVGLITGLQL